MKEKICIRCGKKFLTEGREGFCSDFCRTYEKRICEICGHEFISRYNSSGTTCSLKCANKKKEKTSLERFGVSNISQLAEVKERKQEKRKEQTNSIKKKMEKTCLEKYGVKNALENKEIRKKIEKTCLEKYGSKSILGNEDFRDKYKVNDTFKGDFLEKLKKQNLEKYGVEYNSQRKDVKEKIKQTNLKRYGRVNGNGFGSNLIDINAYQKKIIETKRRNNSFHISKPENQAEIILKEIFEDIKTQYKSKEYPYLCDFYIPSLGLYIELNYHWSHGFKPFDENNQNDLALVEKWKSKNTKYYNEAIKTWTIRDVEKLKTFIDNKLNYKIFYKEEEFNVFINDIKKGIINKYTVSDILSICLNSEFPGSNKYPPSHPIWNCRVGIKNLSPKEAWSNEKYLKKAIDNLYKVYKDCILNNKYPEFVKKVDKAFQSEETIRKVVLERFTIAKIAPKVTALNKNTMLNIIKETRLDLSKYDGVYIPMAGFGGIVEAIKQYNADNDLDLKIEAYDINEQFCNYYGWIKRDVLKTNIETDKIVIACPPFGKNYENWNEKSDLEPEEMFTFIEWCDLIKEHIKAPNYIFIGPSNRNEERKEKQPGLFAKQVGIKWYEEYTVK